MTHLTKRLLGFALLALPTEACNEKVQMKVLNDKANDLRVELSLPDGGAPTLDRVRVLALPADSVIWEASGPPAPIGEISYGDAPANFNELAPALSLTAGGQVLLKLHGDGVRGELTVRIKED